MAGTHIVEIHRMTKRHLQTYRVWPEGVPSTMNWLVSPPCAGLQDMTRHLRNENTGNTVVRHR
eukprot:12761465-Prorocentrum_lima.AAC.2